ncbi:MAG: HNH endonuclease signature motif containing protein [Mycobacterium sp.]|uniref:HNH endonuclease signature motif containing protein n=1 Tax=Mycobacterium sp. TaxID=1785 RepID=UPI003BD03EB0
MLANGREHVLEVFDTFHAAVSELVQLSFDVLTTPERLALLERLEQEARRLPTPRNELINGVRQQATAVELGGKLSHVLADRLRITRADASRRIDEADDLGSRLAITGEPLAPHLPATAAQQRAGAIDAAHVKVIRGFLRDLPCWIDADTRTHAEAQLADFATQYRPELLGKLADKLADCLNPDGDFSDEDRARRRGLVLGRQEADGMSTLRGYLTPATRAAVEAVLAKLAAPGMASPYEETPVLDGTPSQEAIERDSRTPAQRNHDGLHAALRGLLASGELGQHNGLPASIIVTTTLRELEAGTGKALTGGGSLLPMKDVIRLARHAHHYLAIFDKGRAIGLYHTKRLASAGQRIVLYAKDRGCSHPACEASGYYCEVHHVTGYAICHTTDVNDLTFCCGSHHPLVQPGGWQTRKRKDGSTEWIPPAHLERGQPRVNLFHHPEELLSNSDVGDDNNDDNDDAP